MAYMRADTSAKVGFRPMHQTDPFGAAHLSGYGSGLSQGHNPFSPRAWQLHGAVGDGLGAYFFNRPMDPWELYSETAPGLHGLGDLGASDMRDEIADKVTRAREAARHGDTFAAQTFVNEATSTLQGLGYLGNLTDTENEMVAEGYSKGDLDTLIVMGATDQQLQALWGNFAPGTPEYADAYSTLLSLITGNSSMQKKWNAIIQPQPTGTQFQSAMKASGAIPVGAPGNITPPSQTYAAQGPAAPLLLPQIPYQNFSAWIEGNALWIFLGIGAITVLPSVLGRRR